MMNAAEVLSDCLRTVGFEADPDKQPSNTRWGDALHGTFHGKAATAVVYGAHGVQMSSCGYAMDGTATFNLENVAPLLTAKEGLVFMPPRHVCLLRTGHTVAICDAWQCTVQEALERHDVLPELANFNELTVTGGKVMGEFREQLQVLATHKLLHPEIDLTTTVIKRAHGHKVEIRVLVSPWMQRLVTDASTVSIMVPLARPAGVGAPPEIRWQRNMTDGFSVGSVVWALAAVYASMFMGASNSIITAASVTGMCPRFLGHLFAGALHENTSLRFTADLVAGHFCKFYKNYGYQARFLDQCGNAFKAHVYGEECHEFAKALDELGSQTFLGVSRFELLPGGVPVGKAMMKHVPAADKSKPSLPKRFGHVDSWKPSALTLGFRHNAQHAPDKVPYQPLRQALNLKQPVTSELAQLEYISALVAGPFKEASWQTWRTGLDKCRDHVLNGGLRDFYSCGTKSSMDGRSHKADGDHSGLSAPADVRLVQRVEQLQPVPDTWTAALHEAANGLGSSDLVDYEEDDEQQQSVPMAAAVPMAAPEAATGASEDVTPGDPQNSTDDWPMSCSDATVKAPAAALHLTRESRTNAAIPYKDACMASEQAVQDTRETAIVVGTAGPAPAPAPAPGASVGALASVLVAHGVAAAEAEAAAAAEAEAAAVSVSDVALLSVGVGAAARSSASLMVTTAAGALVPGSSDTKRAASRDLADMRPSKSACSLGLTLRTRFQSLMYLAPGGATVDYTGPGSYPLTFRVDLDLDLQGSELPDLVRTPHALLQLSSWHLTDQCVLLKQHMWQLLSAQSDIVCAPYAGPQVCCLIAQHATCHLACIGTPPSTKRQLLGIRALERLYPQANYEHPGAGACVDRFRLWRERSSAQRGTLKTAEGDVGLEQLKQLLQACDDRDCCKQLQVMRECRCPVVWHLFAKGVLAVGKATARTVDLHRLQLAAVKEQLALLVKGVLQKISIQQLAHRALFMGLPFDSESVMAPCVWMSQRVQRQLWLDIQQRLPKVSVEVAVLGEDHKGTAEGCLWKMLTQDLGLTPKEAFKHSKPQLPQMSAAERLLYVQTHVVLTSETFRGAKLKDWRESQGWSLGEC